jgi:hypothetical protein
MLKKNDEDLREFRAKLPKQVRDLLPRDLAGMEDDTRKMPVTRG